MAEAAEIIDQDEDEKELIESVGADAAPIATKEDEDEEETEIPDEPVAEVAKPADAPESAGDEPAATAGGGSDGDKPISAGVPANVSAGVDAARDGGSASSAVASLVKPAALEPDEVDKRFDAAIAKIDADEMLTDAQKDVYKLQLETQREARNERRQAAQVSAEDTHRNAEAKRLGISRDVLDSTWDQACKDSKALQGDYGASKALFQQRIAVLKAAPKPAVPKPATPKATAPTPITPKGARIAPPAAVVPPPPEAKSDEEELIDSVRREQKSGVRL